MPITQRDIDAHREKIRKWCEEIESVKWPLVILENLSPREMDDWVLRRGRFAQRADAGDVRAKR